MISQHSSGEELTAEKKKSRLAVLIATFFYIGYLPVAPGTFASLATVLLWVWPIYLGAPGWLFFFASALFFILGLWASERARHSFAKKDDPSSIVIDEVAGQTLAMGLCSADFMSLAIAFALFRFFDILKPWPIRWFDRNVKGGLGIMIDDVVAGIFALAVYFVIWIANLTDVLVVF